VVLLDDGNGDDDPLHVVVDKGYRGEDARDKKATMDTYWMPGVDNLRAYGRWAFEFTEVYEMEKGFHALVDRLIAEGVPWHKRLDIYPVPV